MDRYTVETVDLYDMEKAPDGMWVMYDDAQAAIAAAVAAERKKTLAALKAFLEGAVMSKYASKAECEAARAALRNAMLDVWGA